MAQIKLSVLHDDLMGCDYKMIECNDNDLLYVEDFCRNSIETGKIFRVLTDICCSCGSVDKVLKVECTKEIFYEIKENLHCTCPISQGSFTLYKV